MTTALAKAREASEIRIGEGKDGKASSAIGDRLEQNVRAGNLTAADRATFDRAGKSEARIRAILDLLDKLRAESRDLAPSTSPASSWGPTSSARCATASTSRTSCATLNSTSTTVAGVRIIGEDEVERGPAVGRQGEGHRRTPSRPRWRRSSGTSRTRCSTLTKRSLEVEAVIARVVQIAVNLYQQIVGVVGAVKDFVIQIPGSGGCHGRQRRDRGTGSLAGRRRHRPRGPGPAAPLAVKVRPRGPDRSASLPSSRDAAARSGRAETESLDAVETLINHWRRRATPRRPNLRTSRRPTSSARRPWPLAKAEAAAREDVKRASATIRP